MAQGWLKAQIQSKICTPLSSNLDYVLVFRCESQDIGALGWLFDLHTDYLSIPQSIVVLVQTQPTISSVDDGGRQDTEYYITISLSFPIPSCPTHHHHHRRLLVLLSSFVPAPKATHPANSIGIIFSSATINPSRATAP